MSSSDSGILNMMGDQGNMTYNERKEMEATLASDFEKIKSGKSGCKLDTDGDGNCRIHPEGCPDDNIPSANKIVPRSIMEDMAASLETYLQAGYKEARRAASVQAKASLEKYRQWLENPTDQLTVKVDSKQAVTDMAKYAESLKGKNPDSFANVKPNTANSRQVGGHHYQSEIQPWDAITAWGLTFLDGSAVAYLARWKKKNGVEDLRKAVHFIEKQIEVEAEKTLHATYKTGTTKK